MTIEELENVLLKSQLPAGGVVNNITIQKTNSISCGPNCDLCRKYYAVTKAEDFYKRWLNNDIGNDFVDFSK